MLDKIVIFAVKNSGTICKVAGLGASLIGSVLFGKANEQFQKQQIAKAVEECMKKTTE